MTEHRFLHLEGDRYPADARRLLESVASVDYVDCDSGGPTTTAEILAAARYTAVLTKIGIPVGAVEMDAAPALRWIVTPTTGLDHIDLDEAAARGIDVVSLRGHIDLLDTVAATAELTWALVLAVLRRVPAANRAVLEGAWVRDPFLGTELRGRQLGVVGHGRLGRMVASVGVAFGMGVLVHDTDPARLAGLGPGIAAVPLDDLLARADVVSLHIPLDHTTKGLFDARCVRAMRSGAILVNTARGELIDEDAVIAALRDGHLGGYGADVVADDSSWPGRVPARQPLIELAGELDNVVVTPHIGGYARDAIETTRRFIAYELVERVGATEQG